MILFSRSSIKRLITSSYSLPLTHLLLLHHVSLPENLHGVDMARVNLLDQAYFAEGSLTDDLEGRRGETEVRGPGRGRGSAKLGAVVKSGAVGKSGADLDSFKVVDSQSTSLEPEEFSLLGGVLASLLSSHLQHVGQEMEEVVETRKRRNWRE